MEIECAKCKTIVKEPECVWIKEIKPNGHVWFIPYCKICGNERR